MLRATNWWLVVTVVIALVGIDDCKLASVRLILEPEDTIASKDDAIVLNCVARGDGHPVVSWKKDGRLVSLGGDNRRSVLANGSLYITQYHTSELEPDEGIYQCLATLDGVGSVLSRPAKLQDEMTARFYEEPEDSNIIVGQTVRFGCAAHGMRSAVVSWFKDDASLALAARRMTVLPSGALELREVQPQDEGFYKCNLTNPGKSILSKSGRLGTLYNTIREGTPPKFAVLPKSQIIEVSKKAFFECSSTGDPLPNISWLKDGISIDLSNSNGRFKRIGKGNLLIYDVKELDEGTYQCRAENREDSVDVSATLQVQVPPKVLMTPTSIQAYEKEDVELQCKIYGKPAPTIQWFKSGDMIIEGDYFQIVNGVNLKILGLVTSDSGVYQCFAANLAGNTQAAVQLLVLRIEGGSTLEGSSAPQAPMELFAATVSTRSVTLTWKPPPYNYTNGRVLSYAVYYKEAESDRERVLNITEPSFEQVNILGLLPNKRYMFRIVSHNARGSHQSSRSITVSTQEELAVVGPPRTITAWAISSSEIFVRWTSPEHVGNIRSYNIFYMEYTNSNTEKFDNAAQIENEYLPSSNKIYQMEVKNSLDGTLENLRIFTDYLVWVKANDRNREGASSQITRVTTFSDVPSNAPRNTSVEPISSNSIGIRWEPLEVQSRNGLITGYKLKYKQKGKKKVETLTTDGNSRFATLGNLENGLEYQIKIAALNVNGTGPFTEWISGFALPSDVSEDQVPDKPSSLHAQPLSDKITISWSPPRSTNVLVRGYTIGWGKGIPDVYNKLVDGKRRLFTLENLRPNSDYVISLRAFNQMGDGIPVYENVRTKEPSADYDDKKFQNTLPAPPVGLRAEILSSTSVFLQWTDSSLSHRTVFILDNRYYVLRYIQIDDPTFQRVKPKQSYLFLNTSELTATLDSLKPDSTYEFSVKMVKNKISSEWSLIARNKTLPLLQSPQSGQMLNTQPEDLTLMALTSSEGMSSVIINWQPPMNKDGDLRGYLIRYTTNPSLKDWMEEIIPDDVLTHKVMGLTPETTYYFQISAKYSKIIGDPTQTKSVTTPHVKTNLNSAFDKPFPETDIKSNELVLFLLIGLSVVFALASVVLCIYYRNRGPESSSNSPTKPVLKKTRKLELNPPDLWIHHDKMELKGVGRNVRQDDAGTPMEPISKSFKDSDEKVPFQQNYNSLGKGHIASYLKVKNNLELEQSEYKSHSLGRRRSKQQRLLVQAFKVDDGSAKHTQNISNIHVKESMPLTKQEQNYGHLRTGSSIASESSTNSSQHNLATAPLHCGATDSGNKYSGNTNVNRCASSLKSFTVPLPPSSCDYDSNPHSTGRSFGLGVINILPSCSQSSPMKRISGQYQPSIEDFGTLSSTKPTNGNDSTLQKCYSTEELSQEISNLEGLMKDLSAITASEFQC